MPEAFDAQFFWLAALLLPTTQFLHLLGSGVQLTAELAMELIACPATPRFGSEPALQYELLMNLPLARRIEVMGKSEDPQLQRCAEQRSMGTNS